MAIPDEKEDLASIRSSGSAIQEYLRSIDSIKSGYEHEITDNVCSLLKDVIMTKDVRFFSALSKTLSDIDTSKLLSSTALETFSSIAEKKICYELNALFEEHSAASAREASLADDLRLQDKGKHHRQKKHSDDSLAYGEIDFESSCRLLQSLPPQELATAGNGIFYDIGSGAGRAVFAARFTGDYELCVGIELLNNLHQIAIGVHNRYKKSCQQKLKWKTVAFHCADLMEYDWSDGTVVYVNNFLFDDGLMATIANKAQNLRSGAYLISLKIFDVGTAVNPPFNKTFAMIQEKSLPMSWGEETIYVYRRC